MFTKKRNIYLKVGHGWKYWVNFSNIYYKLIPANAVIHNILHVISFFWRVTYVWVRLGILYIFSMNQRRFKIYANTIQSLCSLFLTKAFDLIQNTVHRHWPLFVIRFRSHTCSVDTDALNALKQHLHEKQHAWSVRCHVQVGNAVMLCLSRRMHQYKHSSGSHHTMLTWANLLMQSKHH